MAAPASSEPDHSRLQALAHDYGLGELLGAWPATGGIENTNLFLRTRRDDGERHVVLTLLERPPNAGDALVPLLDTCVAAGLPVPGPLRQADGTVYATFMDKPAMVCPRLPGRHVHNPTQRQVEALGRFLGNFHRATAAAQLDLPPYPRDVAWLERQAAQCRGAMSYGARTLMADMGRVVSQALARRDVTALPQGAVHGDLFRDNVLFNEWGLSGVLDFHHAARGHLIYDLAVAANDWCTEADGALDPERTLALLRAYHGVRPLQRAELWHFPVFALYAGLAFWTSRLVVALERRRGRAVRANNPEELQRVVAHHAAHCFYLDERRLEI